MKENIKEIFSVLKEWWKKIFIIIGSYLKEFKKNWVFFTLVLVLFSSATVCLHVGTAKTLSGREEFFHERIAAVARENEEKTVLMNIKPNEYDKELLKKVTNKYINDNFQTVFVNRKYLNLANYAINSENVKCFDSDKTTILFPNVFSSKEIVIDDYMRYRMDEMNLYYINKPEYNSYGADYWCVISSNFANKIMIERDIDLIENVVGEIIIVSIKRNNVMYDMELRVNAIYDSNLGIASKIEKIYGDTILSWFYHSETKSKIYDDISISLELHHDTAANKKSIDYFSNYYNLNNSEIKIYTGEKYIEDKNMLNFYSIIFTKDKMNKCFAFYLAVFLNILLIAIIIIYEMFVCKLKEDGIHKRLVVLISVVIFILGITEIVLLNINNARLLNFTYEEGIYASSASILSILIIPFIFVVYIVKLILTKRKEGEVNDK